MTFLKTGKYAEIKIGANIEEIKQHCKSSEFIIDHDYSEVYFAPFRLCLDSNKNISEISIDLYKRQDSFKVQNKEELGFKKINNKTLLFEFLYFLNMNQINFKEFKDKFISDYFFVQTNGNVFVSFYLYDGTIMKIGHSKDSPQYFDNKQIIGYELILPFNQ